MEITIKLKDIGGGKIRVETKPPVHKLKKMAADRNLSPLLAYAGLMLRSFYSVLPDADMAVTADDEAFADAKDIRSETERRTAETLGESPLLLPGRDF